MKSLLIVIFSFMSTAIFSQNIKCEITDYVKNIDNKEYSTYQYINSSYSYSRALIIMVTSNNIFIDVHQKIPRMFSSKQEYTDAYLLGIKNFNKNNIDKLDEKIIRSFIEDIVKYRTNNNNNNLPNNNFEYILSQVNYLENKDLCKFVICRKKYNNEPSKETGAGYTDMWICGYVDMQIKIPVEVKPLVLKFFLMLKKTMILAKPKKPLD